MSDYTAIPSSTFETDKPVLGSTHLAMYENLIAVTEGAAGAPKHQPASLNTAVLTYTGTLAAGSTLSLPAPSSQYSFWPNVASTADVTAQIGVNGALVLVNNNGAVGQGYTVNWRYIVSVT